VQQPRPKAPSIFVGIDEKRVPPVLIIHGLTWPRRGALGYSGLGCIWKPEKKSWERAFSLKVAETIESWPDAVLSPELRRYFDEARQRAEKQQEYYRQKAKQPPKTKLKPLTSEEREARRGLIEENRKRRETEIETRF
jgi:hypothetical protein